jgi:hemin uptake protein HemP
MDEVTSPSAPATERDSAAAPRPNDDERVIESHALFGRSRTVRIQHNGESYSLRVTRLGKLILTK